MGLGGGAVAGLAHTLLSQLRLLDLALPGPGGTFLVKRSAGSSRAVRSLCTSTAPRWAPAGSVPPGR